MAPGAAWDLKLGPKEKQTGNITCLLLEIKALILHIFEHSVFAAGGGSEEEPLRSSIAVQSVNSMVILFQEARGVLLQGASNRPLRIGIGVPVFACRVFELRDAFPHLHFSINGGITTLEQAQMLLRGEWADESAASEIVNGLPLEKKKQMAARGLHGVMIGRAAMNDPCCLAQSDTLLYGGLRNRLRALAAFKPTNKTSFRTRSASVDHSAKYPAVFELVIRCEGGPRKLAKQAEPLIGEYLQLLVPS